MPHAPTVRLGNGAACIPQHYLRYRHTLESVEQIVLDTVYNERYLVFTSQDAGGIYIQIGIIGFDNYQSIKAQDGLKIVYGRKWRVEPQLPTSEIIQTIFLALQKAREHEVRERLRFYDDGHYTTPFNNHHDLPVMAQNAALFCAEGADKAAPIDRQSLQRALDCITYDEASLHLQTLQALPDNTWVVQLTLSATKESQLPEVLAGEADSAVSVSFIMPVLSLNGFYYGLMDALLQLSNRHVEEHFHYHGFARFSRHNSVMRIAALSATVRRGNADRDFAKTLVAVNYETDSTRVPYLNDGKLADKVRATLRQYGRLNGILPC